VRPTCLDESEADVEAILTPECVEATNLDDDRVRSGSSLEAVLESFDRFLIAKGERTVMVVDGKALSARASE
jgi:hypothetical protein